MKLLTRQTLANMTLARWIEQYPNRQRAKTEDDIRALGNAPDPNSLDKVIGNNSWTEVPRCDECESYSDAVIRFGDGEEYEDNTVHICIVCLRSAVVLADGVQ